VLLVCAVDCTHLHGNRVRRQPFLRVVVVQMPIPGRSIVRQTGRELSRLPPHWLQRRRRPDSGTAAVSESWSTTKSALWRQSSQVP